MSFWQFLVKELIWQLIGLGMIMLTISIITNFYYERTFHRPVLQKSLTVTSNFLAVTGTLVFITALISSVIENMTGYNWLVLGFILLGCFISVKVYKGD